MEPGKTQTLKVIEKNNGGFLLQDAAGQAVFLPKIFAEVTLETGDETEVFIYQDEGELKATNEKPFAEVGEFAVMSCVQTLPSGAFLDWGIIKDLFVPYTQQKMKMVEGRKYLVYVYLDEDTGLVTGTAKFKRNASYKKPNLRRGEKVELIIIGQGDLGWNVVINQKYLGLIYFSDVYKDLRPLSEEAGYIKEIREDGKIDVTLQPAGFENVDEFKTKILKKLEENYGLLYLSDRSSPEEIKDELQMSKKNFKKAVGSLYKEKKIELLEDKIRLS